jgi:aspartate/methionine/tyrosine aminotransferase
MGGFRLGWAIGQADALAALARLKGAVDFNQYLGIQRAVAAALREPDEARRSDAATFRERREVLLESMAAISWHAPLPRASMYVWAPLPAGRRDSVAFAEGLARTTGVALAPGVAFGPSGEGYVRFALVRGPEALRQAVARIRSYLD